MLLRSKILRVVRRGGEAGRRFESDWQLNFIGSLSKPTSPWHNIPCDLDRLNDASECPVVFEMPKGTREKLELATKVQFNPLRQDRNSNGTLRKLTYGDLPFNYGFVPQTYEDPQVLDPITGCGGDGDPLDVVELSEHAINIGEILNVRVLGALGLIDGEEMDWKILTIDARGWQRSVVDFPSNRIDEIRHWFTHYKVTDGKAMNRLARDGHIFSVIEAIDIIRGAHHQYEALKEGKSPNTHNLWLG